MQELVSFIIPVYNTSEYLEECVQSLLQQTYQTLQIILVDDGSTDESPKLCDELADRFENVSVIHKQNQGLGMARNTGLTKATGKYVAFLDSDDTLDPDTVATCVQEMTEKNADACFYGRKTQGKDGIYRKNPDIPDKQIFEKEEIKKEFIKIYFGRLPFEKQNSYIQVSACCCMYKREIIEQNQLRFVSEREYLSEDTFFNLDFCALAKKVMIIPKDFYNYRYNGKSLTKKYNPKKIEQLKNFIRLLEEYSHRFTGLEEINDRVYYMFYIYLRHQLETEVGMKKQMGTAKTVARLKEIYADDVIMDYISKIPMKVLGLKRKILVWCLKAKNVGILLLYYR